jgi:hypothetical protein
MTVELTEGADSNVRRELITRLAEMTTALEAGDDALFQQRLQELLRRRE